MDSLKTDVLIIGAGAAGIRAALAAAEQGVSVLVVTKAPLAHAGSTFSPITRGWGIQALIGAERTEKNLQDFYEDILRVGLGRCDPLLARILVEESGPRLEDLMNYGMEFRKDAQGGFVRVKGCFSTYQRAFLTADMENIRETFLSIFRRSGAGLLYGKAIELHTYDGQCHGAWIRRLDGNLLMVRAGATIIATGGGAGLFLENLVDKGHLGEGFALAQAAGAECTNLEFIQFMLGFKSGDSREFFPLNQLLTPGVLQSEQRRDILVEGIPDPGARLEAIKARQTHFPFSCRDESGLIDLCISKIRKEGEKVLWAEKGSIKKPGEVLHLAHAFNGGIKINERAESTLPGLFAAGESAAGPHGADRIGGCMMTSTQVFGARAGTHAALRAKKATKPHPPLKSPESLPGAGILGPMEAIPPDLLNLYRDARECFSRELTPPRESNGLLHCVSKIEEAQKHLEEANKTDSSSLPDIRNALLAMKLVCKAALERGESLGSHCRSDFPPPFQNLELSG